MAKKAIFNMAAVRHLEFYGFWSVNVIALNICCSVSVSNFIKIGRFLPSDEYA